MEEILKEINESLKAMQKGKKLMRYSILQEILQLKF